MSARVIPLPGVMSASLTQLRDGPPRLALRAILWSLLALVFGGLAWAMLARLDIIASAGGKLVPTSHVKIVQPAESGVVEEIMVRDGSRVRAGQVLARMNATMATADLNTVRAELTRRRLELRRIDAELDGGPLLREPGDDPAHFAALLAQFDANRQAQRDALDQEAAVVERARADLAASKAQREKLASVLPAYREQDSAFTQLYKDGFAGRLMQLDKQRELIEKERDLATQGHTIAASRAAIAQSQRRLAQLRSAYAQRLQAERTEAQAQVARLEQDLAKATRRGELLELRAPQDGVVKDLATHTAGAVLQPGTVLMNLVPDADPLQAEVWVANADIGFVGVGQKTMLKLAAYPFQRYGLIEGRVMHVSADATEPARAGSGGVAADVASGGSTPSADTGPAFKVLVGLDRQVLEGAGQSLRLAPGMAVSAEIHQGTRSVLEYLLSPVQRVAHDAGRER